MCLQLAHTVHERTHAVAGGGGGGGGVGGGAGGGGEAANPEQWPPLTQIRPKVPSPTLCTSTVLPLSYSLPPPPAAAAR